MQQRAATNNARQKARKETGAGEVRIASIKPKEKLSGKPPSLVYSLYLLKMKLKIT
jgi:hypothetical protein